MANNVMREIGIVMGTWYIDFGVDSPATAPEMARCRESDLDLREPPRQRRQKWLVVGSQILTCANLPDNGARNPSCYLLSTTLVFPEEEGMMQQSSVSISLSF